MTSNTESYLPEDIITDHLLLGLPVKSLLRLKCVCKSWRDLVKSSAFVRKHCDSKKNRPRLTVCKFAVDYNVQPLPIGTFNFYLLPEKITSGVVPKNQRIGYCEDVTDFRDIYGPVDGLFILKKGDHIENVRFAWWNPATKTCRIIPKFEFDDLPQFRQDRNESVAVGLDIVNNDYKVVSLRTFSSTWYYNTIFPKVFGALYSLKNDSWKFLEPNYPYDSILFESLNCTYLNELYYWMCMSQERVYSIRTFDFATELFAELEALPIPGDHWGTLMLRGGSLAAMSSKDMYLPMTPSYDIWVRIRENSWMKIFTVNPPITSHWPLAIWEYDKFVYELTETNKMVFYDNTTRRVTSLGFDHFEIVSPVGFCWSKDYKESLVSVKRDNRTEEDTIEHFLTKY